MTEAKYNENNCTNWTELMGGILIFSHVILKTRKHYSKIRFAVCQNLWTPKLYIFSMSTI